MRLFTSSWGREAAPSEDQVQVARLTVARRTQKWTEVPESRLISRGRWGMVDAETDDLLRPYRGVVFTHGSATVIPEQAPLYFTVDADSQLTFFERDGTWSDLYLRLVKRGHPSVTESL